MRLQLAPGDRKILLIGAGVFAVLLATSLVMVHGTSEDKDVPSAYSAASRGCKAAFLLLKESGYHTQTWEHPLGELPQGKGTTLVLAEPAGFPGKQEKEHLARFLKSGGRVIATGRFVGFYLPEDQGAQNELAGTVWERVSALSPSPITRAAPEISLIRSAYWRSGGDAVALYGDSDKPSVVEYRVGDGEVLWLGDAGPITNAGLKEPGNMEFLLSAVGGPEENQVLWDEYIHGYERVGANPNSRRMIRWIFLQLAVLATAILATYSRRSGPMLAPDIERRLSPLEFVRTLGALYEHANAGSVAVEITYQRFRYLLTRRLGLAVNTRVKDLDRAVREHGALEDKSFADTLTACESFHYDSRVPQSTALRLVQSLYDYAERLKLVRSPQRGKNAQHKNEREKNAWKPS
jgi:hypothetical protein